MELGATLCTPRSPRCNRCPIASHCAARAAGTQELRPAPHPGKAVPTIDIACAVHHDADRRLLLVRRPARGLLAGLWSFPGAELNGADVTARTLELARQLVRDVRDPRPLGTVEHQFSHRREHYHCVLLAVRAACAESDDVMWVSSDGVAPALPRAQQRIRALAIAALDA
jgi:A/G-specific adenine glycosylase